MINLFLPTRHAIDGATYAARDVTSDFWYTLLGRETASKVTVTQETALTYSAVWAATRLLSVTPACLPLNLYKRDPGKTDAVTDDSEFIQRADPRNAMVDCRPNSDMIGVLAKSQAFQQQVNAGNAYFEIERARDGSPLAIWPIHYSRVTPGYDDETGDLVYEIKNNNKPNGEREEPSTIAKGNMLHFPYPMSRDGITGIGVITNARESIGLGIATERHGASYFGSGGVPRIIVKHKTRITPDAMANFRKEWKEVYGGPNGDKVGQLGDGGEIEQIKVSPEDAQFLTTRQHNVEEIARWYNVAVHLIQRSVNPGVNNVEQLSIEFVKYSLMPLMVIWEQELNSKLLTPEEQQTMYFRFNFNELLRGDSKSRSEYIRTLIQIGVLTPDEGRIMEGKNPKGGAAAGLFMQGAMMPIDRLGEQTGNQTPSLPSNPDEQQGVDTSVARALMEQWQLQSRNQRRISKRLEAIQGDLAGVSQAVRDVGESVTGVIAGLKERIDTIASAKDNREAAFTAAARSMLAGVVERMICKQAMLSRRASKDPAAFFKLLDEHFGDGHLVQFEMAVQPVAIALTSLGIVVTGRSIAEAEVNRSREDLLTLSGKCKVDELAAEVDKLVTAWEAGRAAAVCDRVIGGQAA